MAEENTVAYLPASLIKEGQRMTEKKRQEQFRRERLETFFAIKRQSRIRLWIGIIIKFFFGK